MTRIAAIGECMLEFSLRPDGLYRLGFGGDTLNTAVYLARLGCRIDYLTALGDDEHSDWLLAAWRDEGVGVERVVRLPGRLPGLYLIETDAHGDRHFAYWRDRAAARDLFDHEHGQAMADILVEYELIYLSGVTLSLYGEAGRRTLWQGLDRARELGARVAFDTNFRSRGWPRLDQARSAYEAMLSRTDVLLSGIEDERTLFGIDSPATVIEQARQRNIAEVVVKHGGSGCSVATPGGSATVQAEPVSRVVDTTAAGDSFNAGYLAARLRGVEPIAACRAGHRLAGIVITHPGAIVPKAAIQEALSRLRC